MRLEQWLGALRERDFRLYFMGQLTSSVGTSMAPVALSFAVLALRHGSASQVGQVLTAQTAPLVVFLLIGGVAADRLGRRRVMIFADALRTSAQAALAGWILVGDPPLWGFMVLSALVGVGTGFFMPAIIGIIPEIVSRERLSQANALNFLTTSIGGVVGPAVAGIVVATVSPGWALAADALTYLVSVISLAALRTAPVGPREAESFLSQLLHGWSAFRSRTWLWAIVAMASVGNMIMIAPFLVLGAVISKQSLGGAAAWGTILAFEGVGAIAGGIAMLRLRVSRPLVISLLSLLTWPIASVALAFMAPVPVICAGAFLEGASLSVFGTLWDTTLQREIPPDVLSRVSAYDWLGSLVFLPIGYVIVGPVASITGKQAVLIGGSAWLVASVGVTLLIPAVRNIRLSMEPAVQPSN